MSRYSAREAIILPRMTAVGAKTLGTQLVSAAQPYRKDKKLSKVVTRALDALTDKHEALSAALRDVVKPEAQGTLDPVKCDRVEDACWSALNGFLESLTKLSWLSIADEAVKVRSILFEGGLRFIQLPYLLQWSESETRVSRMEANGLRARIEQLGGKLYVDELLKAHADYGKALGVTEPLPAIVRDGPVVRAALDGFGDALRKYVVKVMSMVEDDEPETEAIAAALLRPVDAWDEISAHAPSEPAIEPAPDAVSGQGG